MSAILPARQFPVALPGASSRVKRWRSGKLTFLQSSIALQGAATLAHGWHVQAALNISSHEALLARYRRDLGVVLVSGLLVAALAGGWIARRGLRPGTRREG